MTEHTWASKILLATMEKHPELTYRGWAWRSLKDEGDNWCLHEDDPAQRHPRYLESRRALSMAIDEFAEAYEWVAFNLTKIKSLNLRQSSYGYKHLCENRIGRYVANGTMIAAFLANGYQCKPVCLRHPNVVFNVSEHDIRNEERARDGLPKRFHRPFVRKRARV